MPRGDSPAEFLAELCEVTALPFVAAGPSPAPHAPWPEKQAALLAALDPLRLPGAAVVLVGAAAPDLALCTAARLGGYLPHEAYFKQVA